MGTLGPDPRRLELAAFLRARRAALRPSDIGKPEPQGRRRTPGLRREEVAEEAGMSVTWYAWLEQGRRIPASAPIIDALARALRLDHAGHDHLRYLAGLPPPENDEVPVGATPEVTRLLDTSVPAPACALNARLDFLAWNDPFAQIWDPGSLPVGRCNLMWLTFADDRCRRTWVDWEQRSRVLLGEFPAAAGHHAGDGRFAELIGALNKESPEFRSWWPTYDVRQSIAGPLVIRLASVGVVRLDVVELRTLSSPQITVAVHVPTRPPDKRKLTTAFATERRDKRGVRPRRVVGADG